MVKTDQSYILVIDTARDTAAAWVLRDRKVLAEKSWPASRELRRDLLLAVDELVKKIGIKLKNIKKIAIHAGPGGYSSLRVGVVEGSALALAIKCSLTEITSHDVNEIIRQAYENPEVSLIQPKYAKFS